MGKIAANAIHYHITVLLLFVVGSSFCSGQTTQLLTPTTNITGLCQGHASQPGCVLPTLYGPTGITTESTTHYAHFVDAAQAALGQGVNTAIATQLAVLPLISPSSGFTYRYDSAAGAFVRTTTSFGPIYTERAETIGRGKVSFGVSYQRFRFSNIDGIDLRNFTAVYGHVTPSSCLCAIDVVQAANSINLNMDQTMLYGTVGIIDRLDVSVAVPIVSVRMGAISNAQIFHVSGTNSDTNGGPNPHVFPGGALTQLYFNNGSASGIGDVTVRVKGNVWQGPPVRVALAMDVRTPSGDARNYLGAGAIGIKPFVAISVPKRFSPHVNIGYQWNGQSILGSCANPEVNCPGITGVTFGHDASNNLQITNYPSASKQDLPGQFIYSLGADYGFTSRMTFSFDYLGQTLFNSPRIFRSTYTTQDGSSLPGGLKPMTLNTTSTGIDTVGLNSGATGVKINLFGNLLLTADILFRLDNKGLRQDVTPLVALSYAIGH